METSSFGREFDYVRASHDGYGRTRHVRSVLFLKPDVLVVFDRVRGPRPFEAELSWHLCPGETLESFGGGRARLIVAAAPASQFERSVAPFSPRYTQHESAPRYRWRSRGSEVVFATVVALDGSAAPACRLEVGTDGTAVLSLLAPRPLRVIETWSAAAVDVSPTRVNSPKDEGLEPTTRPTLVEGGRPVRFACRLRAVPACDDHGLPLDAVSMAETVKLVGGAISTSQPFVHTSLNAAKVLAARRNRELLVAIDRSD